MIASLSYLVPVQVLVDTETGRVDRVVVVGELVTPVDDFNVDYGTQRPLSEGEVGLARRLADLAEWPGWEFGW